MIFLDLRNLPILPIPDVGKYDTERPISASEAEAICQAGDKILEVCKNSSAAENLSEYEEGYDIGAYCDDMYDLLIECNDCGVIVLWPGGVKPGY